LISEQNKTSTTPSCGGPLQAQKSLAANFSSYRSKDHIFKTLGSYLSIKLCTIGENKDKPSKIIKNGPEIVKK